VFQQLVLRRVLGAALQQQGNWAALPLVLGLSDTLRIIDMGQKAYSSNHQA